MRAENAPASNVIAAQNSKTLQPVVAVFTSSLQATGYLKQSFPRIQCVYWEVIKVGHKSNSEILRTAGETTLAQIIMRERDLLERLKLDEADKKYLTNLFPHYNWN